MIFIILNDLQKISLLFNPAIINLIAQKSSNNQSLTINSVKGLTLVNLYPFLNIFNFAYNEFTSYKYSLYASLGLNALLLIIIKIKFIFYVLDMKMLPMLNSLAVNITSLFFCSYNYILVIPMLQTNMQILANTDN